MAPLRRSQPAGTRRIYKDVDSQPKDGHIKDYAGEAPVKKKPRVKKVNQDPGNAIKAAPKRRRLRGMLQKVAETPSDILFEIFSNLDPLDLLRLSRTTKDLRALLLQRSSTFVWKRARQNVEGLPLPDDLSEPKFAHLAFDKHCDICLRSTPYVQWEARTKYCRKCLTNSKLYTFAAPEHVASFVPSYDFSSWSGHRFGYYYVPAITALQEEHKALTDEMRDAWMSKKRDAFMTLQIHARLCDDWSDSRVKDRSDGLDNLRSRRLEQVLERLTILGWGEELQDQSFVNDKLGHHHLVRQSRLLTERAWSTMSDTLICIVKQHRDHRLSWAVQKRMGNFKEAYSATTRDVPLFPIYPKAVDAALLKPFSRLLFATPLHQDITESLTAAWAQLPRVADEWRETQNSALKALMLKAGLEPNLNLATSFFKCSFCHRLCQYPYVLAHRCPLRYPQESFVHDNWKNLAMSYLSRRGDAATWSASQYMVDGEVLRRVQSIIQACGLDPETATHEDMDSLNCRVICQCCSTSVGSFVMQWQIAAVGYFLWFVTMTTRIPNPEEWESLDDARELERVKILEKSDKIWGYRLSSYKEIYICSHCKVSRCKGRELEKHLLQAHGVDGVSSQDWDWPVNRSSSSLKGRGVFLNACAENDTPDFDEERSRTYSI
ncbi:hypothetical protein IW261DRAFT_1681036 [Armillaria novae-zelandiae]|uniref:F-box domain-containing protein n=1 Tax=Armillaria novae-zelandiae TaxID=153914 RepID=A0AA39PDI9_9AGAR|nr:hypothetical protein IW261DRAFT_1681036 [Armillaria novae-zelandiae]